MPRFWQLAKPHTQGSELCPGVEMRFEAFSFGVIRIDNVNYTKDVVIDRGVIRKRHKKPSRQFRTNLGHTPLSVNEEIPWKCQRLVIGTGRYGALPVMKEVHQEAKRRQINLVVLPTADAIELLNSNTRDTNAILHLTC